MGFWKTARGIGGDSWADELGHCMDRLVKLKVKYIEQVPHLANVGIDNEDGEHEIDMQEFADLIEFCTRGLLVVDVRYPDKDGSRPLSALFKDKKLQTYENRGQIQWGKEEKERPVSRVLL